MIYTSGKDFTNSKHKTITLIGMSGVGKSHLSMMMAEWGWHHYSCDFEIGAKYLANEMPRPVKADDITPIAEFIGKLGNVSIEEFKARQKQYYDAEVKALEAVIQEAQNHEKFVNDSTGSLCEILDDDLLDRVGRASLFVYIKASDQEEKDILERAQDYPKPLFYPPKLLDAWIDEYVSVFTHGQESEIDADEFTRWVFPRLFETRLPKYQRLADMYGVTISTDKMYQVENESDFMMLIGEAIGS